MWWFAASMAWAGAGGEPVGFWHPDDLAPISRRYTDTSEQLQGPFAERQSELERVAAAVREYRVALDLLGDRAPAAERERLERLERDHHRNHALLEAFANQLVGDYDVAFTSAVDRAAAARGSVVQCVAELPVHTSGPRIPGAPGKTQPNPECRGQNLNAALAAAVDADPVLAAALDEIVARPWPALTPLPSEPQPVVGGGDRWLRIVDLVRAGARASLTELDRRDDDARDAIEAELEQATTTEQRAALQPKVSAIEAQTAAARAALAAPIAATAEARMTKWKGEPATGWCANPSLFGGCVGADASNDLVARLVADKKVAATFPSAP